MCRQNKSDKIRNEVIWEKVRVAFVADKMMERRLIWYEHLQRRCAEISLKICCEASCRRYV